MRLRMIDKKQMYRDEEELELLVDFGNEDSDKFIPKGTRATFVKVVDDPNDLTKSLVLAKLEDDRAIIVKETDIKPVEEKVVEVAFDEFNKMMMKANPELRKFHPNFFVRYYYR
jgi:hypothetical protein